MKSIRGGGGWVRSLALIACALPGAGVALTTTTVAEAAPSRADWCGTYKSTSDEKAKWVKLDHDGWNTKNRNYVALGGCDKADDPTRQALVEKWRTQYAAEIGGTPKDFSDMLALYINPADVAKQSEAACAALSPNGPDPAKTSMLRELLGCTGSAFGGATKAEVWEDRPTTSALTRMLIVRKCLNGIHANGYAFFAKDIMQGAPCYTDIQALDRTKLDAELATSTQLNALAKVMIHEAFGTTRLKVELLNAKIKEAIAKDPEVKKVVIDGPEAGIKAWKDAYASHKAAMDAAFELSDKFDKDPGSIKGCSTKMRGYLGAYFAEKRPTTLADARALAIDDVGFPIAKMAMRCEAVDGHDVSSAALFDAVVSRAKRPHDGPRSAAYEGAFEAISSLPDAMQQQVAPFFPSSSSTSRIESPAKKVLFDREQGARAQMDPTELQSEIAKLTPAKDGTLVTFKKVTMKDYEEKCVDAVPHRIDGISDDGKVLWRQSCARTGKFELITLSQEPFVVPTGWEGGLAVGQTLVFMADHGPARSGLPIRAYTDKDKTKQTAFLGWSMSGAAAQVATAPAKAAAKAAKGTKTAGAKKRKKTKIATM